MFCLYIENRFTKGCVLVMNGGCLEPEKAGFLLKSNKKPKIDQRSKNSSRVFKHLESSIGVCVRGIGEFVNGWISGCDSETVDSGQFKSILNVVLNANQHMKFTLDFPKTLWFFDQN